MPGVVGEREQLFASARLRQAAREVAITGVLLDHHIWKEPRMNLPGDVSAEIRQLAHYEVRPESLTRCLAAIHEFVAYVRAREPGTLRYDVWQEAGHPTRFVHLFVFRDAEADRIHSESAEVKKFASILYPECLAPVAFVDYTQVISNRAAPGAPPSSRDA